MIKALLLITVLLISPFGFSATAAGNDTVNRLNSKGQREGWWILSSSNRPVNKSNGIKSKEGRYVNGRKCGAWINYYEDGVTPRLIGEYADNRPSGTYFRFDKKGDLKQASSLSGRISSRQSIIASNAVFSCKMMFDSKEIVAGQVFFTKRFFKKALSVRFWTGESMETETSETEKVDYEWLNTNYNQLLLDYLMVRTPGQKLEKANKVARANVSTVESAAAPAVSREILEAKQRRYYYPPAVKQPRVAKGLVFKPSGMNKLYSENSEIWIDGYFKDGQLSSGKVFIYDRDGVLLRVRVYRDGVYESDGVL